ncbi:DUF389 domain-containing protein [Nocardia sp. CDC159]|uniref:DUF389 domain-containing protein n=1 Tax=Nocardia pulmonis TaxID=2951408 RepID=A0A9X2EAE9_9NOCA|nr:MULTISPECIES: DUF389 domain-containing protein [Nocardia]MCM6774736.1 DUF389 domain-containing protein [Nocardia pulmonis]MCM6787199.1 DUF389 domain-containing protein [Nocardia sp. CDC159]
MLHVRVICPSETTEAALGVLRGEPGATLITVQRGASIEPGGDVIEVYVAREAANQVLDALTGLRIPEAGGIILDPVETSLSQAADRAVEAAPGDPADAVVWEELLAQTHEESTLNPTFLAFITLACLLAVVGVATDSPVTVVGAMVVGPEFGPLAAIAVSLVRRDFRLARQSALALLVGFPVAMGIAALASLIWERVGWITAAGINDSHNVDFIYEVGPFSLVVALLAGAAGMLSLVTSKSSALVGVFISVTTIPAAGYAAVAATLGEWNKAFMSAGQLGVNMIGIVAAGVIVLQLRPGHGREAGPLDRLWRWLTRRR